MAKRLERFTCNVGGSGAIVRTEFLEGREHRVVPTAMIAEGVWPGSNGPIFYPGQECAKSVPTWNHKLAVVYHPQDKQGNHISASDPIIINTRKVGIILDTRYDDKLRTDTWIDVQRANEVDQRIMKEIDSGRSIECSTGLVMNHVEEKGTYNGVEYGIKGFDFCGDHLAILPDRIGAYSRADGGGLNVVNMSPHEPERMQEILRSVVRNCLKRGGVILTGNELSFDGTVRQLSELLSYKYGEPGKYWTGYVHEVFSDRVIFCKGSGNYELYMLDYSVKDDKVSLEGSEKEVQRVVEYRAGSESYVGNSTGQLVLNNVEDGMAFDAKAHIDSLIGNGYEETDRAELTKLPQATLEKIKPVKVAVIPPAPAPAPINNNLPPTPPTPPVPGPDDDEKNKAKLPKSITTWPELYAMIGNENPAMAEGLSEAAEAAQMVRNQLIETITKNPNNPYKPEDLQKMRIKDLRPIAQLAKSSTPAPVANDNSQNLPPLYTLNAGFDGPQGVNLPAGNFDPLPLPDTMIEPAK